MLEGQDATDIATKPPDVPASGRRRTGRRIRSAVEPREVVVSLEAVNASTRGDMCVGALLPGARRLFGERHGGSCMGLAAYQ